MGLFKILQMHFYLFLNLSNAVKISTISYNSNKGTISGKLTLFSIEIITGNLSSFSHSVMCNWASSSMHRFNALTFTYVRVVCAQLPPRLLALPPMPCLLLHLLLLLPLPGHGLIGVGVCRSTCLQIMFIHVYKPLTCTQADEPGRTWNLEPQGTGNWETLGMGMGSLAMVLVLRTGVSLGINVSVINASTALWHFGFLGGWRGADVIPAALGLRLRLRLHLQLQLRLELGFGFGFGLGFVALSTLIC